MGNEASTRAQASLSEKLDKLSFSKLNNGELKAGQDYQQTCSIMLEFKSRELFFKFCMIPLHIQVLNLMIII